MFSGYRQHYSNMWVGLESTQGFAGLWVGLESTQGFAGLWVGLESTQGFAGLWVGLESTQGFAGLWVDSSPIRLSLSHSAIHDKAYRIGRCIGQSAWPTGQRLGQSMPAYICVVSNQYAATLTWSVM
jgi:hypothetical protein